MIKLIIKWLIFAGVILAVCYLPGIHITSFVYAMLVAAVLTLVNVFIKPIIKLVTFPINMFTFGLFNLIINFAILYAISYFIPEFSLTNPLTAFYASLVIAIAYAVIKEI